MDQLTYEMSLKIFNEVAKYCLPLSVLILGLKFIYFNTGGAFASDYGSSLKALLLFFCLIYSYEFLLDLVYKLGGENSIPLDSMGEINSALDSKVLKKSGTPEFILRSVGSITALIFHLGQYLIFLSLVFVSALAPIVFLFGTLLNVRSLLGYFFFLFTVAALTPIIYTSFNSFGGQFLYEKGASFGYGIGMISFQLIFELIKAFGPIFFISLILKSGVGQTLSSASSKAARFLGGSQLLASSFVRKSNPSRRIAQLMGHGSKSESSQKAGDYKTSNSVGGNKSGQNRNFNNSLQQKFRSKGLNFNQKNFKDPSIKNTDRLSSKKPTFDEKTSSPFSKTHVQTHLKPSSTKGLSQVIKDGPNLRRRLRSLNSKNPSFMKLSSPSASLPLRNSKNIPSSSRTLDPYSSGHRLAERNEAPFKDTHSTQKFKNLTQTKDPIFSSKKHFLPQTGHQNIYEKTKAWPRRPLVETQKTGMTSSINEGEMNFNGTPFSSDMSFNADKDL